jgi:hypothetical protein
MELRTDAASAIVQSSIDILKPVLLVITSLPRLHEIVH